MNCTFTPFARCISKPEVNQKYLKLSKVDLRFHFLEKALNIYIDQYSDFIQGFDWEKLYRQRNLRDFAEYEKEYLKDWEYELITNAIDFQIERVSYTSEPHISFCDGDILNWKCTWDIVGIEVSYIRSG